MKEGEPLNKTLKAGLRYTTQKPLEIEFSIVYVIHRLKFMWKVFDFLAYNTFILLAITIFSLTLHWKISIASYVFLILLMIYYILVPFTLQTNPRQSGKQFRQGISGDELKDLWERENKKARKSLLFLRHKIVLLITIITMI